MINKLTEHIPAFSSALPVAEHIVVDFVEGYLTQISFVKKWIEAPQFYRLSVDDSNKRYLLMAEFYEGKTWWVVGFLENDIAGLPRWKPR